MTSVFAAAYAGALALLVWGLSNSGDRRVLRRLHELAPTAGGSGALARLAHVLPNRVHVAAARRFAAPADEVADLLGRKLVAGAFGLLVGALAGGGAVQRTALGILIGAGGYTLPTFRRARKARAEAAAMRRATPDLLDLLSVSVSAGATPRVALDRAVRVVGEPLATALGEVRGAVSLGAPWLVALRRAGDTAGAEELKRLAATLAMSARLGSPVAERIRALAHDVRSERRAEAEERARRAPVTMLFPLVFLILPAFVLIAIAPALIVATRDVG